MESSVLGSLRFRFRDLGLGERPPSLRIPSPVAGVGFPAGIRCGLRDGPRKPLWRGQVMSTEAIQAVQYLKLAKKSSPNSSPDKMNEIFESRFGRLLKADQIAVLTELRRQNEWEIALEVFELIQKEVWYKPDLSIYSDMILMLGKNKLIKIGEQLFSELKNEGLQPDTRLYNEMIGAFLRVDMVDKAMDMYTSMKESGCNPDKLTFTILIRNLEKAGENSLASSVRKDCADYMDFPEKFLQELSKKLPKRMPVKVV